MEFAYVKTFLNSTANSMNTLQFKQMMNLTEIIGFFLSVYGEANFLLSLGGSRILGSIGIK